MQSGCHRDPHRGLHCEVDPAIDAVTIRLAWSRCVALAVHSGPIWTAHHITGTRFARVGKRRTGLEASAPRPLDDLERKLAGPEGSHHEPPPLVRRVGLVVAPAAERDQLFQVEVRATGDRLITW